YDQGKPEPELKPHPVVVKRIRDIERYMLLRYGAKLPDDDAGREDLAILLHHLAQHPIDPQAKMRASIRIWARWMARDEMLALVEQIAAKPHWYKSGELGQLLRLTEAEHDRIDALSIRPFDWTDADMKKKELHRERKRKTDNRRQDGATSREEWLLVSKS